MDGEIYKNIGLKTSKLPIEPLVDLETNGHPVVKLGREKYLRNIPEAYRDAKISCLTVG